MRLLIALLLMYAAPSFAESAKKSAAPKKVLVSFDEDLVQGSMTGAELFLILQKKQVKFDHLFDLKQDFTDEMVSDAENLD